MAAAAAAAAAAETLLKSGEISAMIRQGFISSPSHPPRVSPSSSPPPSTAAVASRSASTPYPSPPRASFPSPPTKSSASPSPSSSSSSSSSAATLFEMIAREDHARRARSKPSFGESQRRRLWLRESVAAALAEEGPGDVALGVSSGEGDRVSMVVHRRVLAARSRFFAEKLVGAQAGRTVAVEICECDDVEAYVDAVGMMYCGDLRRWLAGEEVERVLGLLKVAVDIRFDDAVSSCLEYLEAVPWSESEEEKVMSLLSKIELEFHDPILSILHRASSETSTSDVDSIFSWVITSVLQAKDKKARREMKALIVGLLREDPNQKNIHTNKLEMSKEAIYNFCQDCLSSLLQIVSEAASIDESRKDRAALMGEVSRQADNIQWLAEILIDRRMADGFVDIWASQNELASFHSKIPSMYRFEISRVTAQLCIAIGRGQILVSKDARTALLNTWLEALYEDFGWMKRTSRTFDKKIIEDGLCATILTLSMSQQQAILLRWLDCFLNKGDDCPNIQRAFQVWWRRAFVKQFAGNQDGSEMKIIACENQT